MKQSLFTIAIIAAITFGAISCNKEEKKNPASSTYEVYEPSCNNENASNCSITKYDGRNDAIMYDAQGRITRIKDCVYKYGDGVIKGYKPNNFYAEAQLNSEGRIIRISYGKYRNGDSGVVAGSLKPSTIDSFDARGNLVRINGAGFAQAVTYNLSNGEKPRLFGIYTSYEYDEKNNLSKTFIGYADAQTNQFYGELLHEEYLQYDSKINPLRNETLRLHKTFTSTSALASFNNPKLVRYQFVHKTYSRDQEPWEAIFQNTYNENCFLTSSTYKEEYGSEFTHTHEYQCQ